MLWMDASAWKDPHAIRSDGTPDVCALVPMDGKQSHNRVLALVFAPRYVVAHATPSGETDGWPSGLRL